MRKYPHTIHYRGVGSKITEGIRKSNARKIDTLSNIRFYECPGSAVPALVMSVLRVVFLCVETKSWPFPGGMMEQPDWFIELYVMAKNG